MYRLVEARRARARSPRLARVTHIWQTLLNMANLGKIT